MRAAEVAKAEARGQAKGIEIGFAQGREDASRELEDERGRLIAQAATLLESFSEVREVCLHHLEREAVKLALAIAARVLRREAQTDPLLLIGAVRVALRQLASTTSVKLRVPAQDQAMWKESLALMPGLAIRPQVMGEPGMELGECRMETDLGSADLGLWPQLKAIERGFFDRVGDAAGEGQNADEPKDQSVTGINPTRAGHEHSERDDERDGD
jgi:flagellar assembly protein FliH